MTGGTAVSRPAALVTGGRRGIGRAIAYALAEAGFDVLVNDLERDADADETRSGIEARGRRAAFPTMIVPARRTSATAGARASDAVGVLIREAVIKRA